MRREKLRGTEVTPDAIADRIRNDDAKALVMSFVGHLVANGHAEWECAPTEMLNCASDTGEIFILGEMTVIRIA